MYAIYDQKPTLVLNHDTRDTHGGIGSHLLGTQSSTFEALLTKLRGAI